MPKRPGLLCFLAFAALFLIVNRAAYKGYFQDDDFDTIAWTQYAHPAQYAEAALSPRFSSANFRPTGHFFYYAALHLFGAAFPKWIGLLQAIHLLNVWLLWLVLRRLGAPSLAAGAACLFFGLHMALFAAFWKPMYVFDVLCGTFCLLSLYFFTGRRWLLAFVAFWLAYKAKELAVMLPLVLAAAELFFGKGEWKRRWIPLAPFFLASLSFGLQGILLNPNRDNAYTFHFTPEALAQCSIFYASRIFLVPYLGFALLLAPLIFRDNRRIWFGLAAMLLFFFPLLFLPGRIFSPYCYVPFIGLAALFSGLAEHSRPAVLAVFFLIWAMHDVAELRQDRRATLALDSQIHEWAGTVERFASSTPRPDAVVYAGEIPGFAFWGEQGVIHYFFHDGNLPVGYIDDPKSLPLLRMPRVALLNWNSGMKKLSIRLRSPETAVAYMRMDGSEPVEQLQEGWYGNEGDYRWAAPSAAAQLKRPEGASKFELRAQASDAEIQAVHAVTIKVALDGRELGSHTFTSSGWQTLGWDVPATGPATARVTIISGPAFHPRGDSRTLGIAVNALGFTSRP
jgi:hypothetical protein